MTGRDGEDNATKPASETAPAERSPSRRPPAAWGEPFARADEKWTNFERWLCAIVVLLEVGALSLWVALKGLSSPPGASAAGIVFRALTGSLLLGSIGYLATRKQSMTIRRSAAIAGVVLGLLLAKAWARVGVDWSANMLNWYQQASWLTLFGGLRGIGTRLTLLLALLGGSLATAAGRHITIDLITRFLGPRSRLPVAIVGWVGASVVCFGAAWGFFDHIAIEDFGAKADYSVGQKVKTIGHGIGERWFILRKQIALDFKSFPHVVKGESYADWLSGAEWNAWLQDAGFVDRYGKQAIEGLKIPPEAKRAPMVVVPEKGEPRGELTHIANLVFPIGLFIIGLRFILLSILALSGHKSVDPEAHMELGTGHTDDDKTREAAL